MKTQNNIIIGLTMLVVGLGIFCFWGHILTKMVYLPFTGQTSEAKVIGFKAKGSKWVIIDNNSGSKNVLTGKSPFYEFTSDKNELIKTHSKSPQIFFLFNYTLGDQFKVAYPKNDAQSAIIISWREVPGIVLMQALGLLILVVGWGYFRGK